MHIKEFVTCAILLIRGITGIYNLKLADDIKLKGGTHWKEITLKTVQRQNTSCSSA
jgi:hypothetical protein